MSSGRRYCTISVIICTYNREGSHENNSVHADKWLCRMMVEVNKSSTGCLIETGSCKSIQTCHILIYTFCLYLYIKCVSMGQTLLILSDAFTPGFSGVSVAQSLAFCVVGLLRSLLPLSFFSLFVIALSVLLHLLHWVWRWFDYCFTCFVQVLLYILL